MKTLVCAFISIMIAGFSVPAYARSPAPYGLQWGMSVAEVRAAGTVMLKSGDKNGNEFYTAASMPLNLSDADAYRLIFAGNGLGLQQIIMEGNIYNSDWQGGVGTSQYRKVKQLISANYGEPMQQKETNLAASLKRPSAFYSCLLMGGCGIYASVWHLQDGSAISLRLQGLSSSAGRLVVTSEGPGWGEVSGLR